MGNMNMGNRNNMNMNNMGNMNMGNMNMGNNNMNMGNMGNMGNMNIGNMNNMGNMNMGNMNTMGNMNPSGMNMRGMGQMNMGNNPSAAGRGRGRGNTNLQNRLRGTTAEVGYSDNANKLACVFRKYRAHFFSKCYKKQLTNYFSKFCPGRNCPKGWRRIVFEVYFGNDKSDRQKIIGVENGGRKAYCSDGALGIVENDTSRSPNVEAR